jgi:hypothetical protein
LRLQRIPDHLTDPQLFQTLCKPLQQAVLDFPLQANMVVTKHGLSEEEFEQQLQKMKINYFFRKKVEKELRDLEQLIDISEYCFL